VATALTADRFIARPAMLAARTDSIRRAVRQLQRLSAQRRRWGRRMETLLLGPRPSRRAAAPAEATPGERIPGGEIDLSVPGLGVRLAARVAAEIGDHVKQFATPNSLECYAGKPPVTRRSGTSAYVVAHRPDCHHHLANAIHQWDVCSRTTSGWAREFYDASAARGHRHHAALRALGHRWPEVLWHCLSHTVLDTEATHAATRRHAVSRAAGSRAQSQLLFVVDKECLTGWRRGPPAPPRAGHRRGGRSSRCRAACW